MIGKASNEVTSMKLKYICSSQKTFSSGVSSVAFSNDDCLIAAGSTDTTLHVWENQNLKSPIASLKAYKPITSIQFHPNGNYICAGLKDGGIKMWDLRNKELTWYTPPTDIY